MNQKRYLQELAYYLRSLPQDTQDQVIAHYQKQFEQAKEEGRSEEDAVILLGRPKANADKELAIYTDQTKADFRQTEEVRADDRKNADQTIQSTQHSNQQPKQQVNVFILILLIAFNVIIVLGPAIGIFFTGLGIWFSSIVLMATPLITFWTNGMLSFPEFYPILASVGLGILLFVAMYYLSQLAVRLAKAYFKAMDRLARGN